MTDITMIRGDTRTLDVNVKRPNPVTGVLENVLPTQAWFTAKETYRDADDSAIISLNNVDNPDSILLTNGNVRVILNPADTATYLYHWLVYDLQIKESDGTITTVERGFIEFNTDVTVATS
jgi:hypothetical protein